MILLCPSRECKFWAKDGCEFEGAITLTPESLTQIRCKEGYTPMKIKNNRRTNEVNEELRKERLGVE
jgi:hypothetical protein